MVAGLPEEVQFTADPVDAGGGEDRGDEGGQLVLGQKVHVLRNPLLEKQPVFREAAKHGRQPRQRHQYQRQPRVPRNPLVHHFVDVLEKNLRVGIDVVLLRTRAAVDDAAVSESAGAHAAIDAMGLKNLLVDHVTAAKFSMGRLAAGNAVERHRIEPVDLPLDERGFVDVRRTAREHQHVEPVGRGGDLHQRHRVEPRGHQCHWFDGQRQQEDLGPAIGREDRQPVAGVLPKAGIAAEQAKWLEQPFDLRPGLRKRQRHLQGLDEMPVGGPIDEIVGHVAVRRHVEGEAGSRVRLEQPPHRFKRHVADRQGIGRGNGCHRGSPRNGCQDWHPVAEAVQQARPSRRNYSPAATRKASRLGGRRRLSATQRPPRPVFPCRLRWHRRDGSRCRRPSSG